MKKTQLFSAFFSFLSSSLSRPRFRFFSFLEIGFLLQLVRVSNLGSIGGRKLLIASNLRGLSVSTFGNDRPSCEGTGS